MRILNVMVATILIGTLLGSCKDGQDGKATVLNQNKDMIFSKGEKIENDDRFNGTVWVNSLITADSANKTAVGNVIFEPGARSDWHIHPSGQILLVTGGVGYYQEQGSPKIILHKGDVVRCPPNVPHWHGASPDEEFIQIAVTGRENGPTEWLREVTEEEYTK